MHLWLRKHSSEMQHIVLVVVVQYNFVKRFAFIFAHIALLISSVRYINEDLLDV